MLWIFCLLKFIIIIIKIIYMYIYFQVCVSLEKVVSFSLCFRVARFPLSLCVSSPLHFCDFFYLNLVLPCCPSKCHHTPIQ